MIQSLSDVWKKVMTKWNEINHNIKLTGIRRAGMAEGAEENLGWKFDVCNTRQSVRQTGRQADRTTRDVAVKVQITERPVFVIQHSAVSA